MNEFFNRLRRLAGAGPEWGQPHPPSRPAEVPPGGPAARHAFGALLTPMQEAEEQVVFAPVRADGVAHQLRETWTREPDGLHSRTQLGRAVTVSRSVVPPEAIKVQCGIYNQFDDLANSHCEWCGLGFCRLHRRMLTDAERTHQLCPACFELGRHHLDTWAIQDTKGRRAKS